MYIGIVRAGDIGILLINIPTRSGNEVVIVKRDTSKADEIASECDCMVSNPDATVKQTLTNTGAERADAVTPTTDQDATNDMICRLAGEFDIPESTSLVHNANQIHLFHQVGVDTIENPQQLISGYLYRAVARPAIVDYMQVGDEAEVFEITVTEEAPITGKTLTEAGNANLLPDDVLIVAIEREGQGKPLTPRGDTRIEASDLLTVYSSEGAEPELTDVFGHYDDRTVER